MSFAAGWFDRGVLFFRGSSIAKIIGSNVKASNRFHPEVNLWVYEETVDGRLLSHIINTQHENVKYLPGHKLPRNVVSALPAPARGVQSRSRTSWVQIRLLVQAQASSDCFPLTPACAPRPGRGGQRNGAHRLRGSSPVHRRPV